MSDSQPHDHLSRISTMWTAIVQAYSEDEGAVEAAQDAIVQRYSPTVYRYLTRVLGDVDAADEVFQQFALNFVRGGFRHADPQRGRFRDYLKISLLRLVSDYRRKQARQGPILPSDVDHHGVSDEDLDREFMESCRDDLLSRAWAALKSEEKSTGQLYHAVLRFRSRNPTAASSVIAQELTRALNLARPLTDTGVRKTLQRARQKFTGYLLGEVAQSIGSNDHEAMEREIIELGLHPYCAKALHQKRRQN